jgi:putative tricarboxylic transport membrane protein
MREKNKAMLEIGMNLLFCGVAFGMFVVSHDYDFLEGTILGARTFPLLIGGILVVFAMVNITKSIKFLRSAQAGAVDTSMEEVTEEDGKDSPFNRFLRTYRVACSFGIMVVYFLMLSFLGFLIATVVMIPAMLYLLEYRKPLLVAIITILGMTLLYIAFKLLLGVPLPNGMLF